MPRSLLSKKLDRISASPTLAVSARAAELRAEGHDVISFAAGELDLPVPDEVQKAAHSAIEDGKGRYTPSGGLKPLRAIVAEHLTRLGLPYGAGEVMVAAGVKPGLFEALYCLLEPGDEVLFAAPYWPTYPDLAYSVGAEARWVPTRGEDDFQLSEEALRAAIGPRTRVLLLNSPSNPTGAVYGEETLRGIARVVAEHEDLFVLSDDIYECFTFGAPWRSLLHVAPELKPRVLVLHGLSKSHSMTGWRLGYAGGPSELIAAMIRLQSQIAGNPHSISQWAAMEALTTPLDPSRLQELDRRRQVMVARLRDLPGVTCPEPRGAFYAFPDASALIGRSCEGEVVRDSVHLAELILNHAQVAVLGGEIFGAPGHLRLSYACSVEQIQEGLSRIATFIGRLS